MSEINEQRLCSINFYFKFGKNVTEMYETAFGDNSLSRFVTFEWFIRFKDCQQTTEDDLRSKRSSTSRNENDRRLTVCELANEGAESQLDLVMKLISIERFLRFW